MATITLFILFVPVLVVILLVVNLLLAVHKPDSEKVTAYECGFQPIYGQTRNPFAISFYVVAMLFLIFDLEILLIFPYASCMYSVQSYGFWVVMLFFIVLTIGFVYEMGSGALYFTDQRSSIKKNISQPSKIFENRRKTHDLFFEGQETANIGVVNNTHLLTLFVLFTARYIQSFYLKNTLNI